ncbi:hypothetical protein FGO68_gene6411 [Halteria grandinella]|uniref:Uncharacterized protein n=1 Tax=Halteria grandinella TaxID=5974 RepID=A0A8J8T665_HALGN|nr:hypothetical protein FGO68_gene6411 [Halteria grandinella]
MPFVPNYSSQSSSSHESANHSPSESSEADGDFFTAQFQPDPQLQKKCTIGNSSPVIKRPVHRKQLVQRIRSPSQKQARTKRDPSAHLLNERGFIETPEQQIGARQAGQCQEFLNEEIKHQQDQSNLDKPKSTRNQTTQRLQNASNEKAFRMSGNFDLNQNGPLLQLFSHEMRNQDEIQVIDVFVDKQANSHEGEAEVGILIEDPKKL